VTHQRSARGGSRMRELDTIGQRKREREQWDCAHERRREAAGERIEPMMDGNIGGQHTSSGVAYMRE
jgi:hypothetical protein